jgi:hypothetical protein
LLDEAISGIIARKRTRPNPRRRNARRKAEEALTAETTPLHKQSLSSTSKATTKARMKSNTQEATNVNPKKTVPKADSANTHWLTLPEFFQHLWNLTPATHQVSLPGILGLTILLSTLIQVVLPRIHLSNNSSGTWSLVSNGLRWLIALHDKAIALAWDLITQTHLVLRGQVNAGKIVVQPICCSRLPSLCYPLVFCKYKNRLSSLKIIPTVNFGRQ